MRHYDLVGECSDVDVLDGSADSRADGLLSQPAQWAGAPRCLVDDPEGLSSQEAFQAGEDRGGELADVLVVMVKAE